MPPYTLKELAEQYHWLPFSAVMEQILYSGSDGYYSGGTVEFVTHETNQGDFGTHATTGKALAMSIAAQIYDIYVNDYYNQGKTGPFLCCELSGGNGQLSENILAIISAMAKKDQIWLSLWNNINLRTYEISPALNEQQKQRLNKYNDTSNPNRYESRCEPAQNVGKNNETVYLAFSNELFDALPIDVFMRDDDGKLCMGFCVPVTKNATPIGSAVATAKQIPADLQPRAPRAAAFDRRFWKYMARHTEANVSSSTKQALIDTYRSSAQANSYIPAFNKNQTTQKYSNNTKFTLLYIPIEQLELPNEYRKEIEEYCDKMPRRKNIYYSPAYKKLLNILMAPNIHNNLHFDYFNQARFFGVDLDVRQYSTTTKKKYKYGLTFQLRSDAVDITANPDLSMASIAARSAQTPFTSGFQAALFMTANSTLNAIRAGVVSSPEEDSQYWLDMTNFNSSFQQFATSNEAANLPDFQRSMMQPISIEDQNNWPFLMHNDFINSPIYSSYKYNINKFLDSEMGLAFSSFYERAWQSKINNILHNINSDDQEICKAAALELKEILIKFPLFSALPSNSKDPESERLIDYLINLEDSKAELLISDIIKQLDNYLPTLNVLPTIVERLQFRQDEYNHNKAKSMDSNNGFLTISQEYVISQLVSLEIHLKICIDAGYEPGILHLLKLYGNPKVSIISLLTDFESGWKFERYQHLYNQAFIKEIFQNPITPAQMLQDKGLGHLLSTKADTTTTDPIHGQSSSSTSTSSSQPAKRIKRQ